MFPWMSVRAAAVFALLAAAHAQKKPNIILMNMDDLGYGDLGVFGEPSRETPNLDKMASEGILLPSFYTAAAICSPSRASMLTGRLPLRNGFYSDNYVGRNAYTPQEIVGGIADSELLISEALSEAGYHTKLLGKWHLGHRNKYHPLRHGFKEWFGSPNCHMNEDPPIPVYEDWNMVGRYYHEFPIDAPAGWERTFDKTTFFIDKRTGESNYTRMLRTKAVEYIEARASDENPFFLYWAPDATHGPAYASKEYLGTSKRDSIYGDAVRELDASIGFILSTLRNEGIDNNTLVIFTSDNGAALGAKTRGGNNGLLACGKQTTFEGGFRTPTIAWWPGKIPAGSVSHQVGSQMDFFPTFMEMAGIPLPEDLVLDGSSLLPSWLNGTESDERPAFYYRGDILYAMRQGSYKMHLWTWTTPMAEIDKGTDFCPDYCLDGVSTNEQVDHTKMPVLFNVARDASEKFPIEVNSKEYMRTVFELKKVVKEHERKMVRGTPQLNWCDEGVKNWAPPGCNAIGDCMKGPKSEPFKCYWAH